MAQSESKGLRAKETREEIWTSSQELRFLVKKLLMEVVESKSQQASYNSKYYDEWNLDVPNNENENNWAYEYVNHIDTPYMCVMVLCKYEQFYVWWTQDPH